MTENPSERWRARGLHWHAHLSTQSSTITQRRYYSPEGVLFDPHSGADWVADTITQYSPETVAIEWNTPWGVTLDGPDVRDACRDQHVLARGRPVDALILTREGELYLYLDPLAPTECSQHHP
ncbi:hypothetical protein CDG81_18035 [Actinopolyspora erythraea]|uniref:Uncharacterized protein n=1 Tax=Actinopolyspora erythraea TaxID=414996 RepID=A0A099D1F2_9ACTN|nr:hypothetical protein [Actinopolyspora erythraea]ASU79845.1 hypothetical protein CDG81_18035 [Actinopolyspora erythraea]KGI79637.1 hypothetical protein IL38_22030 [Actinopolyspora erythraea]